MDLFAHRIHNAEYINGCIRLECSIVKPDANGEYHPNSPTGPEDTTFSVNLPLQGFMRSMGVMRDLAKKLKEDGVLKGPDGEGGGGQGGPGGPRREGQRGRGSKLQDLSEENRTDGDGDENIV